jgi:ribosomal protein L32
MSDSSVHVRVCRDCGEEYRPTAVRCADCGGTLEDRFPGQETAPATPVPVEGGGEELAGHRVLFLTPRAADLVPLAERLRQTPIEYRLAEQPGAEGGPPRYALLVPEADTGSALRALAELVAPHEEGDALHAVLARFDAQRGYVECPACGARQDPGTAECPDCGLGLGGSGDETGEPRD